jgi:ABC-type molybdate transport system substrate-binding protein
MKAWLCAIILVMTSLSASAATIMVDAAISLTDALRAIKPMFEAATSDSAWRLRRNLCVSLEAGPS